MHHGASMGRAAVGGSDCLVLEALRAGHSTVPAIAEYAQVEQAAAREALNRLRTQDCVRRYGDRRGARYVAVKARKRKK